ncbi:GNAT family N-acetyltransferase [Halobacillus locisalis]|uniref:GNAT family N-acetyltransferase n=1 Tax=Halobacillus locisalis TaxID=220753 RepID=A0A838CSV9_9BACI|nr:GNAT family N-acetyltransferase [Halobacillus locisalis]MBA2174855.1 GNAT family N-acetyltransferase [Halobacillus locisalis]
MIRTAREKDIGELANLMGELGYPTTTSEMEQRFEKISSNPSYNTQVAEKDGKVVGMIGMMLGFHYEKNENYIRIVAFVVDSKYRKNGIGDKLIQKAEEWAMEQGLNKLVLNSGNRSDRNNAHEFYTNRGFEGKATGFYKILP